MPDPTWGQSMPAAQLDITTVTLLIGPEGGFTETEIEMARHADFQLIRLGSRILRSETAAISLLGIAQWTWGDLQAQDQA